MRRLILPLLTIFLYSNAYTQTATKLYCTADGTIYNKPQLDSLLRLGLPIGKIKDTTVKGKTFTLIKIYKSIDQVHPMVGKYKGKPMPNIFLKTITGNVINTASLKGKLVMINFWSTTCGPCIVEMPELNKLHKEYKDRVVFIAALPEDKTTTLKFLEKNAFDFLIAPGSDQAFKDLGIDGYPKNFFIDKYGIIKEVQEGTPIIRDNSTKGYHVAVYDTYAVILTNLIAGR